MNKTLQKYLNLNFIADLYESYQNELNKQVVLNYLSHQYDISNINNFNDFVILYKQKGIELLQLLYVFYDFRIGFENGKAYIPKNFLFGMANKYHIKLKYINAHVMINNNILQLVQLDEDFNKLYNLSKFS